MVKAFQNLLQTQFSFLKDRPLLVAVSGGLDSMVLTDLCRKSGLNIALAHCNFQLRADESDADEVFIKAYAKANNLNCFVTHFDTESHAQTYKQSTQMAARQLRYEWFETLQTQHKFEYVLTAHHADDNLETFLINLSRGTGLDGLTGIPEINGAIIRPMLVFSRDDIHNYAIQEQLQWRDDSSNKSSKYLRNNIRHSIIPLLKKLNPSFSDSFQSTQSHLKDTQLVLEDYMLEIEDRVIESIEEDKIVYNVDKLNALNNSKAYLYQLFKAYNFTDWTKLTALLEAQTGKQIKSSSHRLLKNRSQLILSKLSDSTESAAPIMIEATQQVVSVPGQPFNLTLEVISALEPPSEDVLFLDFESLSFPLKLSNWSDGDYFYPSGMKGKKKLSKYFKDEKLSLIDKENTVVLYSGDAVVWIVNRRADQRFLATQNSPKILKLVIEHNAHS